MGEGELALVIHDPRQPKVAQLDIAIGIQEDVARLEVSMQDLLREIALAILADSVVDLRCLCSPMTMIESRDCLSEDLPNEVFTDEVLRLPAPSDELLEVTAITVFHDDVDLGLLLVYQAVHVSHDMRMIELAQNVDLRNDLLFLFI